MSRLRREQISLGVSATEVALARWDPVASRHHLHSVAYAADDAALARASSPAAQATALRAALEQLLKSAELSSSPVCSITLCSGILRHWAMQPPDGIRSLAELRLVTRARCAQLFGQSPDDWDVTADWRASGAFLCAAAAGWLIATLRLSLEPSMPRLFMQSLVAAALERPSTPLLARGWICIRSPEHVVLLHRSRDGINACRTLARDEEHSDADSTALLAEIRRQSLRFDQEIDESMCLLDCALADIPSEARATDARCAAWMGAHS